MPSMDEENIIFDTIAVVGVGLIGGSLGMAAKKRSLARRVIGIGRSEQKLMRAKILGAIDDYSLDVERGAWDADLVVICTPVRMIIPVLKNMAAYIKAGAVVTDVGSTKKEVVEQASLLMREGRSFIGGHPMAGSEQAGVEAALPDMFLGATYVLTPSDNTDLAALGKMAAFVEAIGARMIEMSPETHDASAAMISHLPHAISASLLAASEDLQKDLGVVFRMAAGSFKDLTRVSSSSPELWRDICITNADAVRQAIRLFVSKLEEFDRILEAHDEQAIETFFDQAREIRRAFLRLSK